MTVRLFLTGLAFLASVALAAPPRLGLLLLSPASAQTEEEALRAAFRDLGYAEGSSLVFESPPITGADTDVKRNAAHLVESKVDVIFAFGTPATRAALSATKQIPIVFISGDPVTSGFADSLARPGSNATGISVLTPELTAKRFELLRLLLPKASRLGLLYNPANPVSPRYVDEARAATVRLSVKLELYGARNIEELEETMRTIQRDSPDGLVVAAGLTYLRDLGWLTQAVRKTRVPAVYPIREYHQSGALMSYGFSVKDMMHRAAAYIDRILRGARPADLPVQEINTFQLVIDMRVARQLKLDVPPELLMRADEVLR